MRLKYITTKVFFAFALLLFVNLKSVAQNQLFIDYVNQYNSMAIDQMHRYGIPASVTLAQALLESRAGTSSLAINARNHFGIKCGSSWTGNYYVMTDDAPNEHFRVYNSVDQSYEDHSKFLRNNQRYGSLFLLSPNDYKGWCYGLKKAGYATNPAYAQNLIQLIEDYQLYKYDGASNKHSYKKGNMLTHEVLYYNKNYYTIAQAGDTYSSIAKEMKMSERKLRKYNEVDKHAELQEGDIVYFEKKQSKADKIYRGMVHIIAEGQSLHTVAQMYGMRVKTLYKINALSPDHQVQVGEAIRIRW